MSYYRIALAAAATLVVQGSPSPGYGYVNLIDRAVITAHSGRLPPSGFVRAWVALRMRTPAARELEMYMPYMEQEQFIPPINSVCSVRFHSEIAEGVTSAGSIPEGAVINAVDEITCDTGRFVMAW